MNSINSLNSVPVLHLTKVLKPINGISKLNNEEMKQKLIRVGAETYVCNLTSEGKLTPMAKKFIHTQRMKLWHQNHSKDNINKHCTTCKCEFKLDQNGKRLFAKRGPKVPWKHKKDKIPNYKCNST